jgi:hypothetical protein
MIIKYRAVHAHKPWRRVSIHKTLASAIDGKDGAKNLLLRIGRVGEKWNEYGDVQCVFVWEDGATRGHAFRLRQSQSTSIECADVAVSRLDAFDRNGGCSATDIDLCFAPHASPEASALPPAPEREHQTADETGSSFMDIEFPYPDELPDEGDYVEGHARQVLINAFERSQQARDACISHYGYVCQACMFDFASKYGELGRGFIHVHHRVPVASVGMAYRIDAIADLVPVCPNCHAMLHRREPPLSSKS